MRPFLLLTMDIAGLRVAVEAARFERIASPPPGALREGVDLMSLWAPELTPPEPRQALLIPGATPWWLGAGTGLQLERIDARQLHPLPAFVVGLSARVGVIGLLERREQHLVILDPVRLRRALQREI